MITTTYPIQSRPHILFAHQLQNNEQTAEGFDIVLIVVCPLCNKWHAVNTKEADVFRWTSGQFIQDTMPYLTDEQRELLISGADSCFDLLSEEED